MKIFITGGTGLIGSRLIELLQERKHSVTVYTRNIQKAKSKLGDDVNYCSSLDDSQFLDGYDAVINLAGESIGEGRWTKKRKKALIDSRLKTTRKLVDGIQGSANPPSLFISGSAVGYYGSRGDELITESTPSQGGFTYSLCKDWEEIAMQASNDQTRVCILRTAVVLSAKGGMLPVMSIPFKFGLGSVLGTGKQYISWIHLEDMVRGILFLLDNKQAKGVFNMASPRPVSNKVFSKSLAKAMHRPCIFKVPSFFLTIALGESSTLILDSQRAIPERLLKLGFKFRYEYVNDAFKDIYD